jgi:hypothetical protein
VREYIFFDSLFINLVPNNMSKSNHPVTWFEQRVDSIIYRNNRPFQITNKSDAMYCHTLQSEGFKFTEDLERKVRLHIGGNNCVACEG